MVFTLMLLSTKLETTEIFSWTICLSNFEARKNYFGKKSLFQIDTFKLLTHTKQDIISSVCSFQSSICTQNWKSQKKCVTPQYNDMYFFALLKPERISLLADLIEFELRMKHAKQDIICIEEIIQSE